MIKKAILPLTLLFLLTGCTDKDNAKRILTAEGYQNIEITGYSSENLPRLPWQTLHVKGVVYNKQIRFLRSFFLFTDYVNFIVKLIIPCF